MEENKENDENSEIKAKTPVLDLSRLNMPLFPHSKKLNDAEPIKKPVLSRFEVVSSPPDIRGLLIGAFVYYYYDSLAKFARAIGKSGGWVWMWIYTPHKVKVKTETAEMIKKVFKLDIIF